MPHPSNVLPYGVEKPVLGVGVSGARFYFRLWLSKLRRLAKRCVSLSAGLLALCVWLCLITVMRVAPVPQCAQIERRASPAALLKEDANFFIRSGEPSDNRGSYPGRPPGPTGYLSPINMQHNTEKNEGTRNEGEALMMSTEIGEKRQMRHHKKITKAGPLSSGERTTHNEKTIRAIDINNGVSSNGVGARRIQAFKAGERKELETTSSPRYWEGSEMLSRLRNDRIRDNNDVTGSSGHHLSPSPSPVSLPNQAPASPFPPGNRKDRRPEIDNGLLTITRIRSNRQAPGKNLGNPLPNLAPGKQRLQETRVTETDSRAALDIPIQDCCTRNSEKKTHGAVNLETSLHHDSASQAYQNSPILDENNSPSFSQVSNRREKLTARRIKVPKKFISTEKPSKKTLEPQNQLDDLYDSRMETQSKDFNDSFSTIHNSHKTNAKIEPHTADINPTSKRRVLGIKSNQFRILPLADSEPILEIQREIKGEERVTEQKQEIPENNELDVSSPSSISFHPTTNDQSKRETRESEGNRLATAGVNSDLNDSDHSITRRRHSYKSVRGIRDGPGPSGSSQTVECSRSGSRAGSNLTRRIDNGNCTKSYCSHGQTKKTINPLYNANPYSTVEAAKGRFTNVSDVRWNIPKQDLELGLGERTGLELHNLDKQNPTNSVRNLQNDGFDVYSYNVTASDALPLNRSIPDTRPAGCELLPAYSPTNHLPKATVVICFHNEALSVLLRTVHSVLNRTPPGQLDKVILVNDASTLEDLGPRMRQRLFHLDKVVLTQTDKREGLVRARLLGASKARSEVIVFLDAHCECNAGWLEPLLYSLQQDPRKVVSPYIDTIRAESLEYRQSPARLQGGFNWRLEFGWRAAATAGPDSDPIRTPVISGGLFAVTRDFLNQMGGYDPQLNIWGGENFELSFKTWMCGGSLEILPCSRVGHVFRASLPYSFTPGPYGSSTVREDTVLTNLARVATVWMDEFADIFFAAVNLPKDLDIGDTRERVRLREKLQCKPFRWFLQHIFPQLQPVFNDTIWHGQVRNSGSLMCLDVLSSAAVGYFLGLTACHGGINQTLRLTTDHQLRLGETCIVPGTDKMLLLTRCPATATWLYQDGALRLNQTDLCLTSVDNELVRLLPCETFTSYGASNSLPQRTSLNENGDSIGSNKTKILSKNSDFIEFEKIEASKQYDAFQKWKFDYTFNWKRTRRKG